MVFPLTLPQETLRFWIMCTKGIHGQVLIDTLNRYPWLILDWHSIDTSVDTWLILHWHHTRQSVNSWLILIDAYGSVDTWPTINRLLIKCRSSVNWVLIGMSIENCSRFQSRVSINTWLQMPLLCMIQDSWETKFLNWVISLSTSHSVFIVDVPNAL